jgi:hypothetical protein
MLLFFSWGGNILHGLLRPLSLLVSIPVVERSASKTFLNRDVGRLISVRSALTLFDLGNLELHVDFHDGLGILEGVLEGMSFVAKLQAVIPMVARS